MPRFSVSSLSQLNTCHQDLQILFFEVIKYFDCVVIEGYRNEADQNKAFEEGKSKLKYPYGEHNQRPSNAVDVAPYDLQTNIDWNDINRFCYFSGMVKGIAQMLLNEGRIHSTIRWSGDWNNNTILKDEKFRDLVHFEIARGS